MAKNKHITDLDRLDIEHAIKQGISFKKIAAKIGKHHSSVSREILADIAARTLRSSQRNLLGHCGQASVTSCEEACWRHQPAVLIA